MIRVASRDLDWETGQDFTSIKNEIPVFSPATGEGFMAARTNPFTFFQQVRAEVSKVTWPSRRETMITTLMVFVMVILAALFFFAVDQILGWGVGQLLNLAS